jgi:hypothetical protein
MVEARFVCSHKSEAVKNEITGVEGRNVNLIADIEDPIFKIWTPSGQLGMQIVGSAADQFEVGKKYRVTFEEIIEAAPAPVSAESPVEEPKGE